MELKNILVSSFELFFSILYLPFIAAFIIQSFSYYDYNEALVLSSLFLAINVLISTYFHKRPLIITFSLPSIMLVYLSINASFGIIKGIFFAEALLFLGISLSDIRYKMIKSVPRFIRLAFISAVGFFIFMKVVGGFGAINSLDSIFFFSVLFSFIVITSLRLRSVFSLTFVIAIIAGIIFNQVSIMPFKFSFPIIDIPNINLLSSVNALGITLALFFFDLFHSYEIERLFDQHKAKKGNWVKLMAFNSIINCFAGVNGSSTLPETVNYSKEAPEIAGYLTAFLILLIPLLSFFVISKVIVYALIASNALIVSTAITRIKETKPVNLLISLFVVALSIVIPLYTALLFGLIAYIIKKVSEDKVKDINLITLLIVLMLLLTHFNLI